MKVPADDTEERLHVLVLRDRTAFQAAHCQVDIRERIPDLVSDRSGDLAINWNARPPYSVVVGSAVRRCLGRSRVHHHPLSPHGRVSRHRYLRSGSRIRSMVGLPVRTTFTNASKGPVAPTLLDFIQRRSPTRSSRSVSYRAIRLAVLHSRSIILLLASRMLQGT